MTSSEMMKFCQKVSIHDLVTLSKFREKILTLSKIIKYFRPGGAYRPPKMLEGLKDTICYKTVIYSGEVPKVVNYEKKMQHQHSVSSTTIQLISNLQTANRACVFTLFGRVCKINV